MIPFVTTCEEVDLGARSRDPVWLWRPGARRRRWPADSLRPGAGAARSARFHVRVDFTFLFRFSLGFDRSWLRDRSLAGWPVVLGVAAAKQAPRPARRPAPPGPIAGLRQAMKLRSRQARRRPNPNRI